MRRRPNRSKRPFAPTRPCSPRCATCRAWRSATCERKGQLSHDTRDQIAQHQTAFAICVNDQLTRWPVQPRKGPAFRCEVLGCSTDVSKARGGRGTPRNANGDPPKLKGLNSSSQGGFGPRFRQAFREALVHLYTVSPPDPSEQARFTPSSRACPTPRAILMCIQGTAFTMTQGRRLRQGRLLWRQRQLGKSKESCDPDTSKSEVLQRQRQGGR